MGCCVWVYLAVAFFDLVLVWVVMVCVLNLLFLLVFVIGLVFVVVLMRVWVGFKLFA